jgi:hypothetical protein
VPLVGSAHLTLFFNPTALDFSVGHYKSHIYQDKYNLKLSYVSKTTPLSLTKEIVNCIFDAGLTIAGILIAVVGILLSIFISQKLKSLPAGRNIVILINLLTSSIVACFIMSILALYLYNYPGNYIISTLLVNLFFAIIITIIVAIIGTVYNVLK